MCRRPNQRARTRPPWPWAKWAAGRGLPACRRESAKKLLGTLQKKGGEAGNDTLDFLFKNRHNTLQAKPLKGHPVLNPADILRDDLDPEFIKYLSVSIGWEYAEGYRVLAEDEFLSKSLKNEEFGRRRGGFAIRALAKSAAKHSIPYNFRRLDCNGQDKILVKAGRVIIIQESILTTVDHPRVADYKRELADVHALVRQLELELGDQPRRITDWSGCILPLFFTPQQVQILQRRTDLLGR